MKKYVREYSYITVGRIINELIDDGVPISCRSAFYRMEKKLGFPAAKRIGGAQKWRRYSREDADKIKKLIKAVYK